MQSFSMCLILLFLGQIIAITLSCRFESIVDPCECDHSSDGYWLSCENGADFVSVIHTMSANRNKSEKVFHELYVSSDRIVDLGENILQDISFKVITFHDCVNLRTIHLNAFEYIEKSVASFEISGQNQLSDPNIFQVITRMINLEILRLHNTKLTSIPENAFKTVSGVLQTHLTRVSFDSLCDHSPIQTIKSKAFSHLPNLIHLDLSCLQIREIASDAFQFAANSSVHQKLYIDLSYNYLTEKSFDENFSISPQRREGVELMLNYNPISYLTESVFEKFLSSNRMNQINVWQNQNNSRLDCDSCAMYWLTHYSDQISDTFCSDRLLLKSRQNNYINCGDIITNNLRCAINY